jgi:demethylmenaquinone methyltransferase/2-methoxy-6-polyprenyl-1,4-benzoquinol methylase
MTNRFYIEGEGRADGVRDLFAAVAPRYDLVNDLQSLGLHRRWKRRLLDLAGVRPGESALDLCCGTGDIAFALAAAGARVTGVDFSEPMLAVARQRAGRGGRSGGGAGGGGGRGGPEFEQGDALALRFPERSFDLVTIGYGLRNLRSIEEGLAEIARVTRPGGRLLVLDFGKPRNRLWRALYFLHLRTVVPVLGRLFCGDAATHGYILESLRRYPEAGGIVRRMEEAGWVDVEWWSLLGGVMTLHRGRRARDSEGSGAGGRRSLGAGEQGR